MGRICNPVVGLIATLGGLMNEQELVQAIGNEVCEECGPNADCGEDPAECVRIATAIGLLDDYVKQYASQQPFDRTKPFWLDAGK